jgi:uncharacterized membrane protein (DUF373 family)
MTTPRWSGLLKSYEYFERTIVIALLAMLMSVVLWATVALAIAIGSSLIARITTGVTVDRSPLADVVSRMHILHDVFGAFLLILIGLELMKTVVMYLSDHEMHVEVVFTVAMIAIARHAIDLDLKEMAGVEMLGMAALVITLSVAYYLFRRTAQLGSPFPGGDAKPKT